MNKTKISPLIIYRAVELYATVPSIQHQTVAKDLGISIKQLLRIRKDKEFYKLVYDRYLLEYESELPDILRSLVREAKLGSIMAIRLVLEHTHKLKQNLHITISSPFEQFMAKEGLKQIEQSRDDSSLKEILDAEIVVDQLEPPKALPPRTADNTPQKVHNDFIRLDRELQKKKAWNNRRKKLHEWKVRSKAVGIDTLPNHRVTKSQRKDWEDSIIEKEEKRSNRHDYLQH